MAYDKPLSSNKIDTDLQKHTGYQGGWDGAILSWAPESAAKLSFGTGSFLGLDVSSSVPERGEISKYFWEVFFETYLWYLLIRSCGH